MMMMMITVILAGKLSIYMISESNDYIHYSECDGDTTLDEYVAEDPEDETLDALDEDLESQVAEVTLDAPESVENRSNTGRNAEESDMLSSSMFSYYLYTCLFCVV